MVTKHGYGMRHIGVLLLSVTVMSGMNTTFTKKLYFSKMRLEFDTIKIYNILTHYT